MNRYTLTILAVLLSAPTSADESDRMREQIMDRMMRDPVPDTAGELEAARQTDALRDIEYQLQLQGLDRLYGR